MSPGVFICRLYKKIHFSVRAWESSYLQLEKPSLPQQDSRIRRRFVSANVILWDCKRAISRAWDLYKEVHGERRPIQEAYHDVFKSTKEPGRRRFLFSAGKRQFLIDSGASYHLISKRDLSFEERRKGRQLQHPIELRTANGITAVEESVTVYIPSLQNSL